MKKTTKTSLRLATETVRRLTTADLARAAGGAPRPTTSDTCNTTTATCPTYSCDPPCSNECGSEGPQC